VPGDLVVTCEQVDPARWFGARRSLLMLSADALPDLIAALTAEQRTGA
jgi:hypothetical protein